MVRMRSFHFTSMAIGLLLCSALCVLSCDDGLLYSDHRLISHSCWSSHDTVTFVLPASADGADVVCQLSVRCRPDVPYRDAVLRVAQVRQGKTVYADTVSVAFFGEDDGWLGHGFPGSDIPTRPLRLHRAKGLPDTMHVTHVMRQDPLEGISRICVFLSSIEP